MSTRTTGSFRAEGVAAVALCLLGTAADLAAQVVTHKDSVPEVDLVEVVVTATRYEQKSFSSARAVTVADGKFLAERSQFSVLDALDDRIGIWVEKRTATTSDPVIRGLSGANILALIDGNSLSTFWGEGGFAGDDMYGKIDGESVERIEIVRGPAGVMYGSNALGGVINVIPRKCPLGFSDGVLQAGGRVRMASGSSSEYLMGRFETWGAAKSFRYFIGGTAHRSEDVRTGGGMGYVSPSGGRDGSLDVQAESKLGVRSFLELGGQYMLRPETYRSYRPSQSNSNKRIGLTLGYRSEDTTALYDLLRAGLYHQVKRDERSWYTDNTRQTVSSEGYAWWRTYSADIQATRAAGAHRLLYGARYYVDVAESPDDEQFTMITPAGDQQASPGTEWHNAGVFFHDEWEARKWVTLSAGIRYDYFYFTSNRDTFYTKPGDADTAKNRALTDPNSYSRSAVTGGLAAVFHAGDRVNIAATWARGFRMFPPSFGFRQTGQGVLIPNGMLEPVTADLFEVSPRLKTGYVDFNITGYYTQFTNFQEPTFGSYDGSDYLDYNGNGAFEPDERVYVNTANGDAWVAGVEAEAILSGRTFSPKLEGFRLMGGFMYNYGRMDFPDKDEVPLRHTHPMRVLVKLRYDVSMTNATGWFELSSDVVARYDEVEPDRLQSDVGYRENPQDGSSGLYRDYGLPAYRVCDVRGGLSLSSGLAVTLAVENMFDVRYRAAHSRMDGSGRNVLVGVQLRLGKVDR